MQILFATLFIVLMSLSGCYNETENSFNGEVRYISSFDTVQTLSGEKLPYINSIGCYGCDVSYPYLMLSLAKQDSLLAIYDIEKELFLGNFFSIGSGPDDFRSFIITSQCVDSVIIVNDIYDKKLKMIRLPETISKKRAVYDNILEYEGMHEMIFYIDSLLWMKNLIDDKITYTSSKVGYPIKTLYKESIGRHDLDNMLLLSDAIKPDGHKIVSLSGVLNQIDILSLDSDKDDISVTASNELVTFKQLQKNKYKHVKDHFLSIPRCNDKYIFALHISHDTNKKSLYVIDWDGKGIANYLLDEDVIDFCVDWNRNVIYGITSSEEIYKYTFDLNRTSGILEKRMPQYSQAHLDRNLLCSMKYHYSKK